MAAEAALDPILDALSAESPGDPELAGYAADARERLRAAPVPERVAGAIVAGYERLGSGVPVAVRSSATGATGRVETGQLVRVDGAAGSVELVSRT